MEFPIGYGIREKRRCIYHLFAAFKNSERNATNAEHQFQKFLRFKEENEHLFNTKLKLLIIKIANAIAESVNGKSKKELHYLFNLEMELKTGSITLEKQIIKEELILRQVRIVENLNEEIDYIHTGVDLDEEDTMDPEDFSHQAELGVVESQLQSRMETAKSNLELLKQLSTEEKDEIELGSMIQSKEILIYISIAHPNFEFMGKKIIPISPASPLFLELKEKKTNEEFNLGEDKVIIEKIY